MAGVWSFQPHVSRPVADTPRTRCVQDLADLAKAFPEQTIICNHLSMPLGIGSFAEEYGWEGKTAEEWRTGITALAQCPNVFLKLGGQTQPHVVSRQRFARSLISTCVPFQGLRDKRVERDTTSTCAQRRPAPRRLRR